MTTSASQRSQPHSKPFVACRCFCLSYRAANKSCSDKYDIVSSSCSAMARRARSSQSPFFTCQIALGEQSWDSSEGTKCIAYPNGSALFSKQLWIQICSKCSNFSTEMRNCRASHNARTGEDGSVSGANSMSCLRWTSTGTGGGPCTPTPSSGCSSSSNEHNAAQYQIGACFSVPSDSMSKTVLNHGCAEHWAPAARGSVTTINGGSTTTSSPGANCRAARMMRPLPSVESTRTG
mmetsp:Transcript_43831/g.121249  ORF Transcript_43831/g.121249 Transcript_43831/m.121249 type:complete len:235 (+) Transcript_43831:604-1308(+)